MKKISLVSYTSHGFIQDILKGKKAHYRTAYKTVLADCMGPLVTSFFDNVRRIDNELRLAQSSDIYYAHSVASGGYHTKAVIDYYSDGIIELPSIYVPPHFTLGYIKIVIDDKKWWCNTYGLSAPDDTQAILCYPVTPSFVNIIYDLQRAQIMIGKDYEIWKGLAQPPEERIIRTTDLGAYFHTVRQSLIWALGSQNYSNDVFTDKCSEFMQFLNGFDVSAAIVEMMATLDEKITGETSKGLIEQSEEVMNIEGSLIHYPSFSSSQRQQMSKYITTNQNPITGLRRDQEKFIEEALQRIKLRATNKQFSKPSTDIRGQ